MADIDQIVNIDSKISQRIKELRKIHKLTQLQLADKLSVTTKHINNVEHGKARLSLEKMIELCDVLDCSLDYLVLGKSPAGDNTYIPDTIIETFRSGSEKEKALLLEFLSLYVKMRK